MQLKLLYENLNEYPHEMKIRLMRLLGHCWGNEKCECGTDFVKMGTRFQEEFSKNRLSIKGYHCLGCDTYKTYILKLEDPIYMRKIFDLFMVYNPEIVHEVFKIDKTEELAR